VILFDISTGMGYTLYIRLEANMVTKIQKWGNSQGLRIARDILEDARVVVGDEVNVAVRGGAIIITPARHRNLRELLSKIPADYAGAEEDWGAPQGKEVW
jgi:antitoxin MazE